MTPPSMTFRALAIAAGLGMVGTSAWVTLSHVHEPDQRALVVAMAAGSAFAAFVLPLLRAQALVVLTLLGIVLGEGYAYVQAVERILSVREERSRLVATENQPRLMAAARVERLTADLRAADAAVLEETKGGCKATCLAKKGVADEARKRLEQAEKDLAAMPAPKGESKLAAKLGVAPDLVDIALAGAVSLGLLCFQLVFLALGHGTHREEPPEVAVLEPVIEPTPRTRHEEAAEFARAYTAKHGHPPRWADVKAAGFSAATASRALRLVR